MRFSRSRLRLPLNLWPPFLGAGIRVREISSGWSLARFELKPGFAATDLSGSQFGGSTYAVTDPVAALEHPHLLGSDYRVWDRAARVEFLKPGRWRVRSQSLVAPAALARLEPAAAGGGKLRPEHALDVVDQRGGVIARGHQSVPVRPRREARPGDGARCAPGRS